MPYTEKRFGTTLDIKKDNTIDDIPDGRTPCGVIYRFRVRHIWKQFYLVCSKLSVYTNHSLSKSLSMSRGNIK